MVVYGLLAVALSTLILLCYLGFIWWLDRYEREPVMWVFFTFLWGAFGATCLGVTISMIMQGSLTLVVPEMYSELSSTVFVAPLSEEFTKGLFFLVLIFSGELDNETDGLIYGAAAGIGFALVENLLYFGMTAMTDTPEVFFYTIFMRTFFSALVHTISSALFGYTVGYVRHRKLTPLLWLWPVIGFVLAVANHSLWNLAAVLSGSGLIGQQEGLEMLGLGLLLVIGMSLMMFVMTQLSLSREQKIIKKYLRDEAEHGTLPIDHVEIIPYWRRRRKKGWLPEQVPQNEYLEAATLLAFRRYQADTSAERHEEHYRKEIEQYRQRVREYLSGPG
jgi:protease PrsW